MPPPSPLLVNYPGCNQKGERSISFLTPCMNQCGARMPTMGRVGTPRDPSWQWPARNGRIRISHQRRFILELLTLGRTATSDLTPREHGIISQRVTNVPVQRQIVRWNRLFGRRRHGGRTLPLSSISCPFRSRAPTVCSSSHATRYPISTLSSPSSVMTATNSTEVWSQTWSG